MGARFLPNALGIIKDWYMRENRIKSVCDGQVGKRGGDDARFFNVTLILGRGKVPIEFFNSASCAKKSLL